MANIIQGEKLIYLILEYVARGQSADFKDNFITLTMPSIKARIDMAMARGEELEKIESTPAMLAYFKTQTKDCPAAAAELVTIAEFLMRCLRWKPNGKLP